MMKSEPLRILLVDDLDENLIALEALLRRDGVEILTASSGREALELLLAHEFALALLDVQMPEMDGFELAELIRGAERTKRIPIIFVTAGSRDPQRMFRGYESGAVDFLYKPLEPHILRSKVDVFLELAAQRAALAQALRLNEYFIGILGHDLRNPLGALIAGTDMLQQGNTDAEQVSALRRMANAGDRMSGLVEQLLDLTRARLGEGLAFARRQERVDVRALVHQVVDEQLVLHPTRTIRCEAEHPAPVTADRDRLLQLFSNLVANAITHGDAQAPVVVRVGATDARTVVEIHNAGVIPPALLPTLFEPFRQTRSRGLGLGLFIAAEIARAHGGDIEAESTVEAGTTMRVRIPSGDPRIAAPPVDVVPRSTRNI